MSGRCSSRCQIHRADSPQVQSELRPLLRPPSVPVPLARRFYDSFRAATSLHLFSFFFSSSSSPSCAKSHSNIVPNYPAVVGAGGEFSGGERGKRKREESSARVDLNGLTSRAASYLDRWNRIARRDKTGFQKPLVIAASSFQRVVYQPWHPGCTVYSRRANCFYQSGDTRRILEC